MGENCFFKIDFLGYLSNIFLSSSSHITMNILGGKAQRFDGKTQPLLAFSWLRYYSHFIRIIPMIYREKILKNPVEGLQSPVDRLSLYWRPLVTPLLTGTLLNDTYQLNFARLFFDQLKFLLPRKNLKEIFSIDRNTFAMSIKANDHLKQFARE